MPYECDPKIIEDYIKTMEELREIINHYADKVIENLQANYK